VEIIVPPFLTSTLDGSGQLHCPAPLPPGESAPCIIVYEAGWAPERVRTLWSIESLLSLQGIKSRASGPEPIVIPTERAGTSRIQLGVMVRSSCVTFVTRTELHLSLSLSLALSLSLRLPPALGSLLVPRAQLWKMHYCRTKRDSCGRRYITTIKSSSHRGRKCYS
jgi:hypothetical protein